MNHWGLIEYFLRHGQLRWKVQSMALTTITVRRQCVELALPQVFRF